MKTNLTDGSTFVDTLTNLGFLKIKTILTTCLAIVLLTYGSASRAIPVTIVDSSFESPVVVTPPGFTPFSLITPDSWSEDNSHDLGLETYTIADENPAAPGDGSQFLYIIGNGEVYQDVGPVKPNTTYTLVVGESAPSPSQYYGGAATSPNPPPADVFVVSAYDEPAVNPNPGNNGPNVPALPNEFGAATQEFVSVTNTLSTPVSGQAAFFNSTPLIFSTGPSVTGDLVIDLVSVGPNSANGFASSENYFDNVRLAAVPEPSTYMLLGLGGLTLLIAGRRRVSRMV
jgi:hypothetical protein